MTRRLGQGACAIAMLFLLTDAATHVLRLHSTLQAFSDLGYPTSLARPIGLLELACVALFLIPRTSILGGLLLTGYLGGAISAHLRTQDSPGTVIFPELLAAMLWAGPWVREARLRAIILRPKSTPGPATAL